MFIGAVLAQSVSLLISELKESRFPLVYRIDSSGPLPGIDGDTYYTNVLVENEGDTEQEQITISLLFAGDILASDFANHVVHDVTSSPTTKRWMPDAEQPGQFLESISLPAASSFEFGIQSTAPLQRADHAVSISSKTVEGIRIWPADETTNRKSFSILTEEEQQKYLHRWGVVGVCLFMFLNGIISFPPSELVLGISGWYLIANNHYGFMTCIFFAVLGNVLGHLLLYWVGLRYREKIIDTLFWKVKKGILGHTADIDKLTQFYQKYGVYSVGIFRCVPFVRSIISIPAGISEMKLSVFLFATILGDTVWITAWLLIGWILGQDYRQYEIAILFCLVIVSCSLFAILYHKLGSKTGDH